jgi:HEAT repeat protein
MKSQILVFSLLLFQAAVSISCQTAGPVSNASALPTIGPEQKTQCLTKEEFDRHLKSMSQSISAEATSARQELLNTAAASAQCKAEIVSILMKAMDKPNLDFREDIESYYLWRNGAEILGELQASEALQLLISHLNLKGWDFSMTMKHQPAIGGVIKIGAPALPQLDEALRRNPDRSMRLSAVFCIATIGGPSAMRSLNEAFSTEPDECIRRFIKASLDNFDEAGQIKNRADWSSSFACPE